MAFLDEFMETFGGQAGKDLSSNLGIKKSAAAQIVPAVVPMILGGLKRQMETQGGAGATDSRSPDEKEKHLERRVGGGIRSISGSEASDRP